MRNKFYSILLTFILLMGLCVLSPMSASAATSTATAYDVYVTGNYMVGETLTAHCEYYEPSGVEVESDKVTYQWYRRTKFGSETSAIALAGETNPTYKLQDADWGIGSDGETLATSDNSQITVYVQATITNEDGSKTQIYSEYLAGAYLLNKGGPAATSAYIKPLNAEGSMKVGDTLVARFAYQNDTAAEGEYEGHTYIPEGDSLYQWQTRTSLTAEPETIEGATKNTYTLRSEDFGKIIECVITPVAADGTVGTPITAKNHYGNLFYKQGETSHSGTSFGTRNISRIDLIRDGGGRPLFSGQGNAANVTVDIGSIGTFDTIYLKISSATASYLKTVEYSIDGVSYTTVYNVEEDVAPSGVDDKTNFECEFKLNQPTIARYFKVTFYSSSAKYKTLFAFYPYATMQDSLKLLKEDGTVAETLEYDTTYTLQYRLDESADSTCYDYLAVYEQLYDGEELKSTSLLLCKISEHDDYGKLSIPFPCAPEGVAEGYSKKYILKAFSLSNELRPNKDARVWEQSEAN